MKNTKENETALIVKKDMPWIGASDRMLLAMMSSAESMLSTPSFPRELVPNMIKLFDDLVIELARRN